MAEKEPVAELEPQFSSDEASPTPWAEARERLATAEVYWLSTVRPDGRPHVTPIASVWLDDALYFTTGQRNARRRTWRRTRTARSRPVATSSKVSTSWSKATR